jgi:hypothetical protein
LGVKHEIRAAGANADEGNAMKADPGNLARGELLHTPKMTEERAVYLLALARKDRSKLQALKKFQAPALDWGKK